MNSLERVLATIPGIETDYQPFTMLLSLYGASLLKTSAKEYYRNPELWFEGQKAVVDNFDPDILITPFSFPIEAEAFGCELLFFDKYAPNSKKPVITDLSQIKDLTTPDFEKSMPIRFFLESTTLLANQYGKTKAMASPIHAPSHIPALLMGMEMWIDTLFFHHDKVKEIMKKTIDEALELFISSRVRETFDKDAVWRELDSLTNLSQSLKNEFDSPESLKQSVAKFFFEKTEMKDPEFLRVGLLQIMDILWTDHLEAMEHLTDTVRLRNYAQHQPISEYKHEGHKMFKELLDNFSWNIFLSLGRLISAESNNESR